MSLASLIGPAIGAGFGIADLIKGPSKAQKATQNGLIDNIDTAKTQSKDMFSTGKSLVQGGGDKVNTAGNYFSSLLGNREQAQAAADPEITTIMDQFDKAHKAAAEFSPRGGGRATLNSQQPYQMAGTVGKLISAKRSSAADILASLGISEEGQGIQEGGIGTSTLNAGTSAAEGLGVNEAGYQKQKSTDFAAIGEGLGGPLAQWLGRKK